MRLAPIALLLAACHRREAAPAPAKPPRPTAPASVDAGRAAMRPDEAPARLGERVDAATGVTDAGSATDAPAASPVEAAMRAILAASSVGELIDREGGVLLVRYLEATPDGRTGIRRSGRRVCGAAAGDDQELNQVLVAAREQDRAMEAHACEGMECSIAGMEYAPSYRFVFAAGDGGAPRLTAVYQLSEAAMNERWVSAMRRFVAERERSARCPR